MEFEGFKSAWQAQSAGGRSLFSSHRSVSRSLQFLRTSSIRDIHRSEEMTRFIMSLLFGLLTIGVSFKVMVPGGARVAAWLLGTSLLFDSFSGIFMLTRRLHEAVADTTLEFIRQEHRQLETRLRLERFSQRLMLALGAIALAVLVIFPAPANLRENLFEPFYRMAVITAFLALAWRRAKSRSGDTCRELQQFLKDLEK